MPRPLQMFPPMHQITLSPTRESVPRWMVESAAEVASEIFGPVQVKVDFVYEMNERDPFPFMAPPNTTAAIRPTYEVILRVFPDGMEEAEERLDEFRDRLSTMGGWERTNFGVVLETADE